MGSGCSRIRSCRRIAAPPQTHHIPRLGGVSRVTPTISCGWRGRGAGAPEGAEQEARRRPAAQEGRPGREPGGPRTPGTDRTRDTTPRLAWALDVFAGIAVGGPSPDGRAATAARNAPPAGVGSVFATKPKGDVTAGTAWSPHSQGSVKKDREGGPSPEAFFLEPPAHSKCGRSRSTRGGPAEQGLRARGHPRGPGADGVTGLAALGQVWRSVCASLASEALPLWFRTGY